MDAQLRGELAAGGNAFAMAQIPAVNQGANLVAQLDVERNVALGLQMQWNHWLIQSGQSIVSFPVVKSQFVFFALQDGLSPVWISHPGKRNPTG
jgi:hypothetical protein